jgi:hypothetical protein
LPGSKWIAGDGHSPLRVRAAKSSAIQHEAEAVGTPMQRRHSRQHQEEMEIMIKRLAILTITTGLLLHSAQAIAQVSCEAERREFAAAATALRDEMNTIAPGTPGFRLRICRNLQRGISTYEKATDYLRRCNGTDKQKTDLSALIQNMKRDFQQHRCETAF